MGGPSAELHVYRTLSLRRSQRWAWRIVAANGRCVAIGGEGYTSEVEAGDRGWMLATGHYLTSAKLYVYRTRSLRRSQRWAWRIVAANGRNIAASGEGYGSKDEAGKRGSMLMNGSYALTATLRA